MLSKNARTILKIAKSSEEQKVAYLELKAQLSWDFDKVKSAGDQLISAGLASEKYYSPIPGQRVLWGVVLTEKGRNSRKYFWVSVGEFLFKSIAVPIVVAFITALITAIVTMKVVQG